jgi:hypothetical protein
MKSKVVIDTPERLEDDIEDFKLDCVDEEKNYTTAKIKLCRDPENNSPIIFYSQELSRNFKDPSDKFGKRHLIKVFTPENITAVADTTLEGKFNDTIMTHKERIPDYAPLTDIHSEKMNLFMDDETAGFLSDVGVNIDGLGEDFMGLESVSATPFMEDISSDATELKRELADLKGKYLLLKQQMADEFEDYISPGESSDEDFSEALAKEKIPEAYVQTYLALKEQINILKGKLGEVNSMVYSETTAKIKLPKLLEEKEHDIIQL